ncbi:MAG: DUF1492 domain-containing protein [Clostridiales bacterium]|nr:DUF1492 domain-containing protein [Clostridiales bacterium]
MNKEIAMDEKRLAQLEEQAKSVSSPKYDGMPHSHDAGSMTEKLVAEIVDLQAIIAAKHIQCIHEKQRLERYIEQIDDAYTRQIFELRFVERMAWDDVAYAVGGEDCTAGSVKKKCYRYVDSTKEAEAV